MRPQEAFDQLGAISLADHTLSSVMEKVAVLAKRAIPGAAEVSVTVIEGDRAKTVSFTGELAIKLDERQYADGHGPCLDGAAAGQLVHIDDMTVEERWPEWAAEAAQQGALSSLSIPVPLQREVTAALNVYATAPGAFDEASRQIAAAFSAVAGVALANTHLYDAQVQVAEQLRTAMESRATIEQAKGILMGQQHCSADAAFELLVTLSQHSNTKLKDVAEQIVREATA